MPNTPCVFPFQYGEGGNTYYGCADVGWGVSSLSHESLTVNYPFVGLFWTFFGPF